MVVVVKSLPCIYCQAAGTVAVQMRRDGWKLLLKPTAKDPTAKI